MNILKFNFPITGNKIFEMFIISYLFKPNCFSVMRKHYMIFEKKQVINYKNISN